MDDRILDVIDDPSVLKVLSDEELEILAQEIREQIITTTSKTGGHVASSLGAVEIILALHSLLDVPHDKIVFDVGHQAYAHKLLTGRREDFDGLRSYNGISGFPNPDESPYDVHPSGHASDALSVATGLAKARTLSGTDEKIVAVVGDASLSGGMSFEALNYIGQEQLPILIVLNDNEMSISPNVGALVAHFGTLRTDSRYRDAREAVQSRLESRGVLGQALVQFGKSARDSIKQFLIPRTMIFEQLGIVCTTPVNGHDIHALREMFARVLPSSGPVLVHVVTQKGAGYEPALEDPEHFHGVGPYNIQTGAPVKQEKSAPTYTEVFGQALVDEATRDEDIVAITAAMSAGTGLKTFAQEFPDRFIDVGIAEEQAVGMASGLAAAGKKPVVAIYSTFMQRAFDQVIIDVALPRRNVIFALDRGGIVGADGPTHHGMFDIAYMRMIPHMCVMTPSDEAELASALHTALALGGPFAIRYPRGTVSEGYATVGGASDRRDSSSSGTDEGVCVFEEGLSRTVREGSDIAILAFGRMVESALAAADELAGEGIEARVVDMRWVKPLDRQAIVNAAQTKLVVSVEEGIIAGGAGQGILEVLSDIDATVPTCTLGIDDTFVAQGDASLLLADLGLDGAGIARAVRDKLTSAEVRGSRPIA